MTWQDRAACLGYSFVFDAVDTTIGREQREAVRFAKDLCAGCPVTTQCYADAMATEGGLSHSARYSVRAGLTPAERAQIKGAPHRAPGRPRKESA